MTIRRKAQLVTLLSAVGFVTLLALGLLCGMPLSVIVIYGIAVTIVSLFMQCPQCGKPLNWNPVFHLSGRFKIWGWTIDSPRRCSKCDAPLE